VKIIPSRKQISCAIVFLALLVSAALPSDGQGLGTISGTVTDPSGAVVPSSTVTATQPQTGASTEVKTNERGSFVAEMQLSL